MSQEGWDLGAVVSQLREIREGLPPAGRSALQPMPLPSRQVLGTVVDDLAAALFPQRLALPESRQAGQALPEDSTDYFVGHTLDACLCSLRDQIQIELAVPGQALEGQRLKHHGRSRGELERRAHAITREFALQLPRIRTLLDSDLEAAFRGDPAALSLDEVLVCYPGVKAITSHRFAHALHGLGAPLVAPIIGTAVIGDRVRLYQAVTLGAKSFPQDEHGYLVKGQPRHPIVEDDGVIYAGATILGRVTIGRGSRIGGNVWLTSSVDPETTLAQAKVVSETFGEGGGI